MDPDTTLMRIRYLLSLSRLSADHLTELLLLIEQLDDWLTEGKRLPWGWRFAGKAH